MEEHGMYFAKKEFYDIIREHGGVWNDSKERPIVCLMQSLECNRNKSKKIHIVKNKVLLSALEYKLSRILELENRKSNYFRQHITDVKQYLIEKMTEDK